MIRAILFDLDGTLVDTLPYYLKSYDQALQEQGFHFTDKEIVDHCFGKSESTICTTLGIPEKSEAFTASYFANVKSNYQNVKLFDGAESFLIAAKPQMKLGIISFAYNWYVTDITTRLDIDHYFDIMLGHDDVVKPKPDPEAALLACSTLGVEPQQTMMVGDSSSDIAMGKAAGCQTALFYPADYELFYDLGMLKESRPDSIIHDFAALTKLLQGIPPLGNALTPRD